MIPGWKIKAHRQLAAMLSRQPRIERTGGDRDRIKAMAGDDFLGVFEAAGGRRRGAQLYCPFHDDGSPSAEIWEGQFHCWGCGLRLDVFGFVMKAQRIDFKTALHYLARRYGITLNHSTMTRAEWGEYARRQAAAIQEARALVEWRDEMLAALRDYRDECLKIYHRALRLIMLHSLRHPRADLWADIVDWYEKRYQEMDCRIDALRRTRWADLLPHFRARSAT